MGFGLFKYIVLSLMIALFCGCQSSKSLDKKTTTSINVPVVSIDGHDLTSSKTLVTAVFVEKGFRVFPPDTKEEDWKKQMLPNVIYLLYDDGTFVWSKDPMKGGSPLYKAEIPKSKIEQYLLYIEKKKYATNKSLDRNRVSPDSTYTVIFSKTSNGVIHMISGHDAFEANTNLVATSNGGEILGQRDRSELLKNENKKYQSFRAAWADIKQQMSNLVPKEHNMQKDEVKVTGEKRISYPKKY